VDRSKTGHGVLQASEIHRLVVLLRLHERVDLGLHRRQLRRRVRREALKLRNDSVQIILLGHDEPFSL
jgi:hypothetical protein